MHKISIRFIIIIFIPTNIFLAKIFTVIILKYCYYVLKVFMIYKLTSLW